jgi:hypothetical protein
VHERFFIALFADVSYNPELADSFSHALGLFQAIGHLLGRYQDEGALRAENPSHSAASLLGPLIYTSMVARSAGNGIMPPIEIDVHIRYFLEGRYQSNEGHRG